MATNKQILKKVLLSVSALVIFGSNILNYFYFYKTLDDVVMQWRVAMISISFSMFTMSFYIWLSSKWRILTGWLTLYLFANFVGVLIGYDLHTKGFMMIMFVATFFGLCHLLTKLWLK